MDGTTAITSVADLVTEVGGVVSEGITWMGDVATAVVGNPLLLFGVVISFASIGIALFKNIFHA